MSKVLTHGGSTPTTNGRGFGHRVALGAIAVAVILAVVLGISLSRSSSTRPSLKALSPPATSAPLAQTAPPVTTTTLALPSAPTAPSFPGVSAAAVTAITGWETANGPTIGTWVISSAVTSTVDSSYVLFKIGPASGYETSVQPGYGFAQSQGDQWVVIGYGSFAVGCSTSGSSNPVVPAAVMTAFGLACPTA
jgi:hypothetical protein